MKFVTREDLSASSRKANARHRKAKNLISKMLWLMSVMLFANTCMAQADWSAYQPRTLKQIIESNEAYIDSKAAASPTLLLTGDHFPSRVKVIYTGKVRGITATNQDVMTEWAKARKVDKAVVDLFQREMLFIENSVEYWLPVQKQLIPHFERELKSGETVELFVMWIGARKTRDDVDWVFLVNEFQRQ